MGCRLQSGCDGRPAQGRRTWQPLRLFGSPAPTITASTPELVSHRTRPESPGSSLGLPTLLPTLHLPISQSVNRILPTGIPCSNLKSCMVLSRSPDSDSCLGDELESNALTRDPPPLCLSHQFASLLQPCVSGSFFSWGEGGGELLQAGRAEHSVSA